MKKIIKGEPSFAIINYHLKWLKRYKNIKRNENKTIKTSV